jgi:predicted house-cleaning NTP pyrophosphatase (Maf/HAM1 superfamily)
VIVAADTVVDLDNQPLGKPTDLADARRMLEMLRGRPHEVVTTVNLIDSTSTYHETVATPIVMRPYSDAELERYLATGQAFDKAGAYAIQDPEFAPGAPASGCYMNAIGLPLCAVERGLLALGRVQTDEVYCPSRCRLCNLGASAIAQQDQERSIGTD